jgi:hypothetical protein
VRSRESTSRRVTQRRTRTPQSEKSAARNRCSSSRVRRVSFNKPISGGLSSRWRQFKVKISRQPRRRLTPRSSGAPTAGHQGPVGGTLYIFANRALASCRRRPLSSNVRPHKPTSVVTRSDRNTSRGTSITTKETCLASPRRDLRQRS